MQAAIRLAKLWAATTPRLCVNAVTVGGRVVNQPKQVLSALGDGWMATFSRAGHMSEAGLQFLEGVKPWPGLEHVKPPGYREIAHSVNNAKPSACGPDGVPYEAWQGNMDASCSVLFDCNCHMLSGGFIGADFNQQMGVFIGKGPSSSGPPEVGDTRPLGLKDSGPKLITSTNVKQFSPATSKFVAWIQRGFVGGRHFVRNIPDLDTIARIMSLKRDWGDEATLILWDFATAFPSIFHSWVESVFLRLGFPEGFLDFLNALLFHNFAIGRQGGRDVFLFLIVVGI
jgi:hypothetical protein